jgi:NADPH-dependent curcumin reductase CurA
VAAPGARFALCGALSGQLGPAEGAFPRLDLQTAIAKDLTLSCFATEHTPEQIGTWHRHFSTWVREKSVVLPQTLLDGGIDDVPGALVALLGGACRGNTAVRLRAA